MTLSRLYGIREMARTAGALSPAMRVAFDKARRAGDFTVADFFGWFTDAGGQSAIGNVGGRLRLRVADPGEQPTAEKPIIVVRQGRRGPGGAALYRYAFGGAAGHDPKTTKHRDAVAALRQQHADDGGDDPTAERGIERLLPEPDPMGDFAQSSMAKLVDAGIDADHPMWQEIADSDGDTEAHAIIKRHVMSPTLVRPAVTVAKHLFRGLNKSWDGSAPEVEPANVGAGRKVGQPWKKAKPAAQATQDEPDAGDTEPDIDIDALLGDDDWEVATEPDVKAPEPEPPKPPSPPKEPEKKPEPERRKIGSWMSKVMKR